MMRIALLQPCYWPEVRRGSERLVHDLGTRLVQRGHDMTLITSHYGRSSTRIEEGIRVRRNRRLPAVPPLRWYEDHLDSTPGMMLSLLRGRFDVAHAFHTAYAWAAVRARALGAPPLILSLHGIPTRRDLVAKRYRIQMWRAAVEGAAVNTVLSEAAATPFRRYLLVDPIVLPGGVLTERFAVQVARREEPTVICPASLGDRRKGSERLFAAFRELRRRRPDARLLLVRTPDPFMSTAPLPPLPDGTEWLDAESTEELATAYARAWCSVLPATGEAFGLVLLESLAAGTPAVAARDGGGAPIVDDPSIGRLFDPDDDSSLVEALEEALALGAKKGTPEACRARAAEYDWSRLITDYENLYERAAGL